MADQRWYSKDTIALVTGANQGIGLQIVRELAKQGMKTILTSRDESKGLKAVQLLHNEGLDNISYHVLDISSPESVQALASWVSKEYGEINVLVNNAGVVMLLDPKDDNITQAQVCKTVIQTNYYGTKGTTEALLPLMKPGSRIINVSSKASDLNYLRNEWKAKLEDIPNLTRDSLDEMIACYLEEVVKGKIEANGWPVLPFGEPPVVMSAYCTSKAVLNAYARILHQEGHFINSTCPGATATRMSGFAGHSVEEGADTAVWLSLAPKADCGSGNFFVMRKSVGFSGIPFFYNGKFWDKADTSPKEMFAEAGFGSFKS